MQIGEIIRKYRKEKNLTQEEMAKRLGVTAPAVNKWENGNSYPDILLLAPISRLLGITVDILLSFQEELSQEEINQYVREVDEQFKKEPYEMVFRRIKELLEKYPNCDALVWQMAVMLDAHQILGMGVKDDTTDEQFLKELPKKETYEEYILNCYERVLHSEDEKLRACAADSLFSYYFRKEQYEKAESYLNCFSQQNPEYKRKQAQIFSKTGRREEAYKTYEELLFSGYQMINMVFTSLYLMAMEDKDWEKAHLYVDKLEELAKTFEMGRYREVCSRLDLATAEKDVETVLIVMETMLESVEELCEFQNSALYEHMTFKKIEESFWEVTRKQLLQCFTDEETYGFLKGEERWRKLISDAKCK